MEMAKMGDAWVSIPRLFAPHSIFAGDQHNQWLYHCYNGNYSIEIYDQTGKLFRKFDRPYEPVPFTNEDKQKFMEKKQKVSNGRFAEIFKNMTFPGYKTVSEDFLIDDQSRPWVRTHETRKDHGKSYIAYDIFNQDGLYEARVWIDVYPQQFTKGKMYSMVTDNEADLRMIKRYRVVWSDEN
jgi:hypothetical protein